MIYLSTLIISMFITITLTPLIRKVAIRVHAMDIPDERKVHSYPIPKAGGIAMALGALIPALLWTPGDQFVRAVLLGAGIVFLLGLIDDFRNLGYKTKFAGQIAAALIVIFYGGVKIKCPGIFFPDNTLLSDWVCIPLTLIVIVGVTNAINLSDGLDGLAGGISLLGFACIGYLAYQGENIVVAILSVAAVGAIFGFLRFNTYPATLFMGDTGSQLLGFLAVTLSLGLTQGNSALSPLLPLIILGFPVLDTVAVTVERISKGKSPFKPDKNHFHHKLMRLGLFHTEAVLVIYALQAFLVTSAFVFRFYSDWFLLISYIIFSGLILSGFFVVERRGWRFKRTGFLDRVIKGRLRVLKEKNILIKTSFRIVQVGVPSLLFFSCLLPSEVPAYVSAFSIALLGLIVATWLIKEKWTVTLLGLALYLLTPFVIYLGASDMIGWMSDRLVRPYNMSFAVMALFVILTLKFTRRRNGFRISPMDFLILFIALVVPNLPDVRIGGHQMGLVAAKIIVLFFSYEVLIGELRGKTKRLWMGTIPVLVVLGVRGLV